MTVRCAWCGKKLQRATRPTILPLCREHTKYRHELRGEQARVLAAEVTRTQPEGDK
jgi:phage FluMu protein Com